MITIFVHRNGETEQAAKFDRAWLNPASGVLPVGRSAAPSIPEALILSDTFAFHPLSVEDAMRRVQYPKVEAYDGYLYVILHGIDFQTGDKRFSTHDVDFFLGPNYLVTVHDGDSRHDSRSCAITPRATRRSWAKGRSRCFTASSTRWSTHYRPEVDKLEDRIDELEKADLRPARAGADAADSRREARDRGAAPHHHAAARRRSPGWRAATSSTSAPRCRSASATSTITSCASPTTR